MGATPGDVVIEHCVEYRQEFAHTGHEGNVLRFPGGMQSLIKARDNGVVACSDQGGHEERSRLGARPPQQFFKGIKETWSRATGYLDPVLRALRMSVREKDFLLEHSKTGARHEGIQPR